MVLSSTVAVFALGAIAGGGVLAGLVMGVLWVRRTQRTRTVAVEPPAPDVAAENRHQHALAHLGRLALEGVDPSGLATDAVRLTAQALGVSSCGLYQSDGTELYAMAMAGSEPLDPTSDAETPPVVLHAMNCVVAGADDAGNLLELSTDSTQPIGPVRSLATRAEGPEHTGVLVVASASPWVPTGDDLRFLTDMAGLLAMALQRRSAEEEAHHRALHDTLTGLANRALFLDRLHRALARHRLHQRPVGVVFIDIDDFKAVNDNHGHAAADQVLIEVGERLAHVVRPVDTVARFGGDEFTLLCEDLHELAQLDAVARRVQNAFARPFLVRGSPVGLTASIGMSYSLADTASGLTSAERLLQDADTAMYAAKARGRDCVVCYDDTMREGRITRLVTQSELRDALAYDQLTLRYQPVVELATEQVRSVEGLVRWRHPTRGLVSPQEFIPISEESGIIEDLGAWVIRQAALQATRWRAAGLELSTSVNLSARQLASPQLVDTLDEVLTQSGLAPELLCLEISETVLMTDVARSMTVLSVLHDRGLRIAVDDFGTGYSSLAYLQRLPVDMLKIDRVFIDTIDTSSEDRSIAAAIIGLAHSLGLAAVAEGVESHEQLAVLRDLGCDRAQGYLFARPAHPDELDLSSASTPRVGA